MKSLFRILLPLAFSVAFSGAAQAQANSAVEVDRIVAVVNDEVITLGELRGRLDSALAQLKRQGTPLPPREVLERQMLERLIVDRIQLQTARDTGLRVDDTQLDQAINRIAAGNKMTVPQFRQALEKDGIRFAKFREEIREEMTVARLREREVDNRLVIGDAEVDNFIAAETAKGGGGEEVQIAHILLRAPESASPEQLQKLKAKADDILQRIARGDDFSQLAASFSDAPDALQGGNMSPRPLDRLPGLFAEAVGKLKPGEVSPILRSPNGFHIVKLVAKKGGIALPPVQQTHARHILIRVNELVSESEALHKLTGLRDRLAHGGDFAELARLYSQDGSAAKGGDLGWLYPGDTVPEFERAMDALQPKEISQPTKSPFGFHLIQVLERRVQDVSEERQRQSARQVLRERKLDEAYQDWLRQLRDRAYVEYRLEER
ncbi:peptidylprolyl isomerase [Azospira restricta]|uniref:Chaperone SurA n=1 Tax=Azospira restricta TaxID=404405 RepID=A0A974SP49_9RHOO|nr:peptidylprolyl isomerase [Azospira restricta]QRJ63849.1 peptidylprolyl isomerase [Azospira restricta]